MMENNNNVDGDDNNDDVSMGDLESSEIEIGSSFKEADSNQEIYFKEREEVKNMDGEEVVAKGSIKSEMSEIYKMLQQMMEDNKNSMEINKNSMESINKKLEDNKDSMESMKEEIGVGLRELQGKFEGGIRDLEGKVDQLRKDNELSIKNLEKNCTERTLSLKNLLKCDIGELYNKDDELNKKMDKISKEYKLSNKRLDSKIDKVVQESKHVVVSIEEKIREQLQEVISVQNKEQSIVNEENYKEMKDSIKMLNERVDKRIVGLVSNTKKYQEEVDMKWEEKERSVQKVYDNYEEKIINMVDKYESLEKEVVDNRKELVDKIDEIKNLKEGNPYKINNQVSKTINEDIINIDGRKLAEDGDHSLTHVKLMYENDPTNENNNPGFLNDELCTNNRISSSILANLIKVKGFSGECRESPLEYLHTLEELFLLNKFTEQEKLAIACNNLFLYAKEWWRSLFEKPNTFGDFRHLVMSCYWSEDRQDQVRYRVSQEKYNYSKGSYIQFFRSQAVKLKGLNAFPLSEMHILKILRHNMPKNIEQMLIAANCRNLEDAAEILDAIEMSEMDGDIKSKNVKEYKLNSVSIMPFNNNSFNNFRSRPKRYNTYYNPRVVSNKSYKNNSNKKGKNLSSLDQPSTSGITTILKKGNSKVDEKTQTKIKSIN